MRKRTQALSLALPLASILAIIVASFVPETWKMRWGIRGSLHWAIHFIVFAIVGILNFRPRAFRARLIRFAALIVVAILLESLESAFFGNPMEWSDVSADLLGLMLAMYWPYPRLDRNAAVAGSAADREGA